MKYFKYFTIGYTGLVLVWLFVAILTAISSDSYDEAATVKEFSPVVHSFLALWLVYFIVRLLAKGRRSLRQPTSSEPATEDSVEKLKKLKDMLEADLITAEEFEAKKADILSTM